MAWKVIQQTEVHDVQGRSGVARAASKPRRDATDS